MSINIKIKDKPDLKKMEISELVSYMENDFNFKTSYSYEELKEIAEYLRELAVQGNTDAQYAYATFYPNVYFMPWYEPNENEELRAWEKDVEENEWYQKAILTYEAMNTSDPEILLRIGTAYINKFLGEDTDTVTGVKICEAVLNLSEHDEIKLETVRKYHFKACLRLARYYKSVAMDLYENESDEDTDEETWDEYDYDSEYSYLFHKSEYLEYKLDNVCNDQSINTIAEMQCIQGARTFHSARYNHAAKWYLKSAERGYAPAMCYYAKCLNKGIGGAEKNVAEAEMWLIKAIESGLNYALLWLGDFYLENCNTYTNAVEDALECYELATECGVYDAYKKLYKCYAGETKYPFEKNEEKADKYLKLSQHEENLKLPYRIISAIHYGSDVDGVFNLHRLF